MKVVNIKNKMIEAPWLTNGSNRHGGSTRRMVVRESNSVKLTWGILGGLFLIAFILVTIVLVSSPFPWAGIIAAASCAIGLLIGIVFTLFMSTNYGFIGFKQGYYTGTVGLINHTKGIVRIWAWDEVESVEIIPDQEPWRFETSKTVHTLLIKHKDGKSNRIYFLPDEHDLPNYLYLVAIDKFADIGVDPDSIHAPHGDKGFDDFINRKVQRKKRPVKKPVDMYRKPQKKEPKYKETEYL